MTRTRRLEQEWLSLQRARALTLASLRDINERLEAIRPELCEPQLDGYTHRLGGTRDDPGICGLWLERFIEQAVSAEILSEEELVPA